MTDLRDWQFLEQAHGSVGGASRVRARPDTFIRPRTVSPRSLTLSIRSPHMSIVSGDEQEKKQRDR